jgi:hypothetical protein
LKKPSRRPFRAALTLVACVALAHGCDVPSSPPRWETRWIVPAESTTIDVASMAPSGITVSDDRSELLVDITGDGASVTLGDICPACAAVNGQTVPKPAFTATIGATTDFPADIDSVTLSRGFVEVRVTNGTSFDLLRPSAAPGSPVGTLVVTVRGSGAVIAVRSISGTVKSLPPGSTLVDTLTFDPAALPRSIGSPVETEVSVASPAGDPVTINTSQSLAVDVGDASVGVSSARVRVQARSVSSEPIELDLADLDAAITDRVTSGALLLEIDNPFAVAGNLTATIWAPGITLLRPMPIAPGQSSLALSFSGDELRSLFGQPQVTLTTMGDVSAIDPGGMVTVTPAMALTVRSRLELYLTTTVPEGQ